MHVELNLRLVIVKLVTNTCNKLILIYKKRSLKLIFG